MAGGAWILYSLRSTIPQETACKDIPDGCIVFAPAFIHLGKEGGVYVPGTANENIAKKLEACAHRIKEVYTQKAVSDALDCPDSLRNGVPVFQMHQDVSGEYVNTIEAFQCALELLEPLPDQIVLAGHPRHLDRARFDLDALYDGRILLLHLGDTAYAAPGICSACCWAIRNGAGWIRDAVNVAALKAGGSMECPDKVRLSPRNPKQAYK